MIAILESVEKEIAAAVLARASFSIEDDTNPAGKVKFEGEESLRNAVLNEARSQLGLRADDCSANSVERLSEFLDIEIDRLLKPSNTGEVLEALARKGQLPSDLYLVRVMPPISQIYGKHFDEEYALINETVHAPDAEQSFGPSEERSQPHLVSLFLKNFPNNKYVFRSFKLLCVGQRVGRFFDAHQAWRIYEGAVPLGGSKDLVGMLKKFADVFGYAIKYNGVSSHFIYSLDIPQGSHLSGQIEIEGRTDKNGNSLATASTLSWFNQEKPFGSPNKATLICSIDLLRYKSYIERHGWGKK